MKGKKTGGRISGTPNKVTAEYKQAIVNLMNFAAPQMVEWLTRIAKDDPDRALSHVEKFGEHLLPKLSRSEVTGDDGGPVRLVFGWED